jgi:hypothetical protein
MGHHYITEIRDEKFEFTTKSRIIVTVVFIVGLILAAIGAMNVKSNWDHTAKDAHASHAEAPAAHDGGHAAAAPAEDAHAKDAHAGGGAHHHEKSWVTRVWANFVMNSYYFMLFSVGALFFIAVNYAANSGWSTLLKRVAEAVSGYLPVAFITIGAVVLFGKGEIYHWYQYLSQGLKEGQDGYDAILAGKTWFLNNNFFTFGVIIIIGLWILFRTLLRRASLKEDNEGGMIQYLKSIRLSAAFLVIFAFSFSILSWMIMMSIDAHWFSTIFSVYNFAIAFVTGLTVLMFFTLYLKSKGYLEIVSDEVIHDLGKFMFAFSIFWAYIWLAQFLLIWYANLPEEVVYYDARLTEQFKPLFLTNVVMNFALPFLILMMRNAKRNPKVLLVAGSIILLGHWLDMYLMVMPGTLGDKSGFGLLEIGMTIAFAGLFIYVVLQGLSKANLIAKNHPFLLESANHDVGV